MFRNGLEPWHIIVIAIVVMVLFGGKKMPGGRPRARAVLADPEVRAGDPQGRGDGLDGSTATPR